MRAIFALAITLTFGVVTGCAHPQHLSDALTFHSPDGWKNISQDVEPDAELWQSTNKNQPGILSLYRDMPAFDATVVVKSLVDHEGKLITQHKMTLCGNQPSEYSQVIQKARHGSGTYTFEIVTSRTPSALWEAQYMYQTGIVPNVQARDALYELCPKA